MKDYYVHVSSDDSSRYFPDNKANDFTVLLPTPLELRGRSWKCALVQTSIPDSTSTDDYFTICCDFLSDSIIDGQLKPVLRRLRVDGANAVSLSPQYITPKYGHIDQMHFSLRLENNSLLPVDKSGKSYFTLHFVIYGSYD